MAHLCRTLRQEKGISTAGPGKAGNCQRPLGRRGWEMYYKSLEEHPVYLTTEPSVQHRIPFKST